MPAFANRAAMLDASRTLEKKSYYLDLLPWLKEWGYNVLHFHITDDQGSALEFPSHPALAKDGAFTADEMRSFVREARVHGIEVIPEIECLGHARYITTVRGYKHLGAAPGHGQTSLDPDSKDVRKLLRELLEDTARVFSAPVLHAGLDEVNLRRLPQYRDTPEEDLWKPFARHAAWVHREIRKLGRRPAMWGDHVLSAPKMARRFEKDVLMFDWHYGFFIHGDLPKFFCDRAFETWGCGATSNSGNTRVVPTIDNLENLRHFSAVGLLLRNEGLSGMVNTAWCPQRYLPGAADYPLALGGHLFSVEGEDPDFATAYAAGFYGLNQRDAKLAGAAIRRLHETAPVKRPYWRIMTGGDTNDPFTRMDVDRCADVQVEMRDVARTLTPAVKKARRHAERLNDLVLSAKVIERMAKYGASGRQAGALAGGKTLLNQCVRAWKRERHEYTSGEGKALGTDHVLGIVRHLTCGGDGSG